jgi:tetratricopeptide (TPR) repeat protein
MSQNKVPTPILEEISRARTLFDGNEPDMAYEIIDRILTDDPDCVPALWMGSVIAQKARKMPVAWYWAKRITELEPERFQGWLQYGYVAMEMWQVDIADRAIRKALKYATSASEKAAALSNLSGLYIRLGQFSMAEPFCRQALLSEPQKQAARSNLGFCQLARKNWEEGWENYAYSLGSEFRKLVQYKGEPLWDGTKGLTVAIYGEQGLGDELSFASMIPDALDDCEKVIIDCDARLKGLFQRSFPKARVYGTRWQKKLTWEEEDQHIHASIPMGGLGGIYRRTDESFPGTAYLVADPDRALMWRTLFDSKDKPAIGIAWSGGLHHTGARFREWKLNDLLPIFESVEAHWVCLQYKDSEKEISEFLKEHPQIDLVQYPYGTLTKDYDDTAALVSALDRVITIQTAVAHLAGALGKPVDVFVPRNSQWRYLESGERMPWYKTLRIIRQSVRGHWSNSIHDYSTELEHQYRDQAAA